MGKLWRRCCGVRVVYDTMVVVMVARIPQGHVEVWWRGGYPPSPGRTRAERVWGQNGKGINRFSENPHNDGGRTAVSADTAPRRGGAGNPKEPKTKRNTR